MLEYIGPVVRVEELGAELRGLVAVRERVAEREIVRGLVGSGRSEVRRCTLAANSRASASESSSCRQPGW